MKLNEIISHLKEKRDKVLNGGVNCIPLPFRRFKLKFPGIQQGKYYLCSASTKVGKTQLANYLFLYNTILYAYYNPDVIYPKIFYYPLEETPKAITLRFISFLIAHVTSKTNRKMISPSDLESLNENMPLSDDILEVMESEEFKNIYSLYEECVTFLDDKNQYGIYKNTRQYVEEHGKTYYKDVQINEKDAFTGEIIKKTVKQFDHYEPNNPDEYVMVIIDHIGIIDPEKGMTKYESINKLSANLVELRNKYNVIPIVIQQQNQETTNLEAFKANRIRPTVDGLRDSKQTAHDCNVFIGLTSPYRFEISNYMNYDITVFKDNIRFMEIVLNRDGGSNDICPLFFEGNICSFNELPKPNEQEEIQKVYQKLNRIRELQSVTTQAIKASSIFTVISKLINKKWQTL